MIIDKRCKACWLYINENCAGVEENTEELVCFVVPTEEQLKSGD